MGNKKNYTKFSERFKKSENQEVNKDTIEEIKEEMVEEILTQEVVETALDSAEKQFDDPTVPPTNTEALEEDEEKIVTGVIVNCNKLNLRELPTKDSKVLKVLNKGDEVGVFPTLMGDFYKVVKMETEGYCMAKYIKLK